MEAMNQSGQPRNSGKRGPMWPAPLTSGGLALEEVTCRVGPTPTVLLLFDHPVFFCLFKDVEKKNGAKEPRNSTP